MTKVRRMAVHVKWVDSAGSSGWRSFDELHSNLMKCETIGWLVLEDKEKITIALNGVFDGTSERPFGEFITIPKVAILKRHGIKVIK